MSDNKVIHSKSGISVEVKENDNTYSEISTLTGIVDQQSSRYLQISGNVVFLNDVEFSEEIQSSGIVSFTNISNNFAGYFEGNGSNITNIATNNIVDFASEVRNKLSSSNGISYNSSTGDISIDEMSSLTLGDQTLYIDKDNKRVSINNSITSNTLYVNGDAKIYGPLIVGNSGSSYTGIRPEADDTYNVGTSNRRWNDIWATNTSINSTSDERRKEQIEELPYGTEFIENIKPVQYKWKDYGEKKFIRKHFGIVAQQLKQTLEEKNISTNDFGAYIYDPDSDSYAVRYGEFIPILIKCAQELSNENKQLKARLDVLEKIVESFLE